jgi:hypothetical protein
LCGRDYAAWIAGLPLKPVGQCGKMRHRLILNEKGDKAMPNVWLTEEMNKLLDGWKKKLGTTKEGLLHSILMLTLTDDNFMNQAKLLTEVKKNEGVAKLEKRGL